MIRIVVVPAEILTLASKETKTFKCQNKGTVSLAQSNIKNAIETFRFLGLQSLIQAVLYCFFITTNTFKKILLTGYRLTTVKHLYCQHFFIYNFFQMNKHSFNPLVPRRTLKYVFWF